MTRTAMEWFKTMICELLDSGQSAKALSEEYGADANLILSLSGNASIFTDILP